MSSRTELDDVLARNLRELIANDGLTHGRLAEIMNALGFKWTANRVAQAVTLRRKLTLAELAGLCGAFGVPLSRLLVGEEAAAVSARHWLDPQDVPGDVWVGLRQRTDETQ